MRRTTLILLALCFLSAPAALADNPSPAQVAASAFVQKFYDWYTPVAHQHGKTPSWVVALDKQGAAFDPGLVRALRADGAAQKKVSGDIVGLDFDPFLSSQDPKDKYTVGEATEHDGVYVISVYGVRSGRQNYKPDLVVEVKASKDSFVFTNFRYGADGDLVGTLKTLKDQRAKTKQ